MSLSNKIERAIPIDDQNRIGSALHLLLKGVGKARIATGTTDTLTMDDCFLIASAANAVITAPVATEENKDKLFVVQFTNSTVTDAQVNDDADTPAAIVVANAQYDIFIMISLGDPSLGSNGYFVMGIDGCAVATS
ncbi:MAG TPA: hypothetical protein PLB16_05755 [bacterium]|nr:hypothetical protein [bacterium]